MKNPSDRRTQTRRRTRVGFDSTNWTMTMMAADQNLPGSSQALEQLCQKYWRPIYAFLRQRGHLREEAQDLTQGFFLHLLQRRRLSQIHPSKGRLRSFLLAALQNYIQNQRDWARAKKRGGGQVPIPIELVEPATAADPAAVFDLRWAGLLFNGALEQLREKCQTDGKAHVFESAREFLSAEAERGDYAPLAHELQMTESALRTVVSRLRAELRAVLRAEVAKTVANPAEIDDELRYLLSLAGNLSL